MIEWLFYGLVAMLAISAVVMAVYPLRTYVRIKFLIAPVLIVLMMVSYWQWGGFSDWKEHIKAQHNQQKVQAVLDKLKDPDELIEQLKAQIQTHPQQAKGWYLLGRLYSSQGRWQEARDAFDKAHDIEPDNVQYAVNYAQSLLQLNNMQFNDAIRKIFTSVLKQQPKQPDAMAMLAMDAFMSHDYSRAINYWQQLLKLVPEGSDDAKAIRQAIAKAQTKLAERP